ncbi:hypothetical protein [Calidithermus roseus]|uniref:hypothetical protein n=1 Tax=Calidithermus roseus TaxID=1644118 RepID=UPI0011C46E7F|nr:hypothetical protein [Calidithermus roseus]
MSLFTGGRVGYSPANPRLRVLHAWGNRERGGFYRELTRRTGTPFKTVGDVPPAKAGSPLENYGWVLRDLPRLRPPQRSRGAPLL